MQLVIFTGLALLAFAGNSVLCRLALSQLHMDATSFTLIRLISGALMLCLLVTIKGISLPKLMARPGKQDWLRGTYLFLYAAAFSYAYVLLDTAAGALILFGSVQFTLVFMQIKGGQKPALQEVFGMAIALAGFVYWTLPDAQRPSPLGASLMIVSGIAWAFYTLAGKNSRRADLDTCKNFIISCAFLCLLLPAYWLWSPAQLNGQAVLLAVASGAITSALGYWLWYQVLPSLSTLSAGVLQLSVPILAALGGLIWAHERITLPFMLASLMILTGILLVILAGNRRKKTGVFD